MKFSIRCGFLFCFSLLAGKLAIAGDAATARERTSKAMEVEAAVRECDAFAAIPLEAASNTPVLDAELLLASHEAPEKFERALNACRQAAGALPGEPRLELQALRLEIVKGEIEYDDLIGRIRPFALRGSAEGQYLLYKVAAREVISAIVSASPEDLPRAIDRRLIDQAASNLKQAAAHGHIEALHSLVAAYENGPLLARDERRAAETAIALEKAPMQGDRDTDAIRTLRAFGRVEARRVIIERDSFSEGERKAALPVVIKDWQENKTPSSLRVYVAALRYGRGTKADPELARKLLNRETGREPAFGPMLADMIARGEGGPQDVKTALGMLQGAAAIESWNGREILANLYLDGKVMGRRPLKAIELLTQSPDLDQLIKAAHLLRHYYANVADKQVFLKRLTVAAMVGERDAAIALARLKLSRHGDFMDEKGARALLQPLISTDREAYWLYLGSQYANLSTSMEPYRVDDATSDADLKLRIDKGVDDNEPEAMVLKARMLRKGVVYRQDDVAATKLLVKAAKAGDVTAALLAGDACQKGLGTERDTARMTALWRQAVKGGSLAARERLAKAFNFDFMDRRITLKEGIASSLVLYFQGYRRGLGAFIPAGGAEIDVGMIFSALDSGEFPPDKVATATMDAFREAPDGLEERLLVDAAKGIPEEYRVAIEKRLKKEGFFKGDPTGDFGPDVRDALVKWVDEQGPVALQINSEDVDFD